MGNAAPVVFGGGERLAFHLVFGVDVPEAHFDFQVLHIDFADGALYQSVCVNGFPIGKVRLFVDGFQFLNVAVVGNDTEQAGTFQVGDDNFTNPFTVIFGRRGTADYFRES